MANLKIKGVSKSFGDQEVIRGVDLSVSHGEFLVFVGPSGCGKSTMLRLITGLEDVSEGRIFIDERDVTLEKPSKRGVAMVFQSYALFPHMTVEQNIGFGLRLSKVPKETISRKVAETAAILQVEDLLSRKPRQLSGGQRQRVAIGRSIIGNPKVFLFDEPLSNLDAALRVQMRLEIARLHKRLGTTVVYVTHDQTEAMTLADRIVVFNKGMIEQTGSPIELYERPVNKFVASFIGSPAMNFLDGELAPADGTIELRIGVASIKADRLSNMAVRPMRVAFGIRPEHIQVVDVGDGHLQAKVEIVEKLGSESVVYFQTEISQTPLVMRAPPGLPLAPGDNVGLRFDLDNMHLFGSDGRAILEA